MPPDTIETHIGALEIMDARGVDWSSVRRTAYLIHQQIRYDYPGDIHDLRQRLMIVPPGQYGGQRVVTDHLEVTAPAYEIAREQDAFGNRVLNLFIEHIERAVSFTAWIVVERDATADSARLFADSMQIVRLLEPTSLTMPDDALRALAEAMRSSGEDGLALAERINQWVHGALAYAWGITDVATPAAAALSGGRGVCQDYAHIMLALCRLCGLPARYVSGHLLGEGGTHAWVEVLLPDPGDPVHCIAHPFDPTNGCVPGLKYITVAVGRDYRDVAPTSGTYRAPFAGALSAHKRAEITAVEYFSS